MTSDTDPRPEFDSAQQAARDPRILVFGRLMGAAYRLEYILGRDLEAATGLTHSIFELLLVVGRAGPGGIPVRDIAQARVLTSGGATRLVHRAVDQGLITRTTAGHDARVTLIELTPLGEAELLRASTIHARNVQRLLVDVLPPEQAAVFSEAIRTLSISASRALPIMP